MILKQYPYSSTLKPSGGSTKKKSIFVFQVRKKKTGEALLTSKPSWALWVVLAVEVVCCC